jgi:CheY-like chemotaxis protein
VEAVARFESFRHDIAAVMLDVQMPVLGGLEAYARIRALSPTVPVILSSGYVGTAELAALREAGAEDLFTKPYEMRELLERLASCIAGRVATAT